MDHFFYRDGELFAEDVPVTELAKQYGTPCYVYSRATLERHYTAYTKAMGEHPHLICYAVKANSNLAVLNVLAKLGAGFDIVSVGELERVLAAGGDPAKVVFSGVAKQEAEIARALEVGIHCFNVESEFELERIQKVAAQMDQQAAISLRINPDVDAKTHPYISTGLKENKFGISFDDAISVFQKAAQLPNLEILGVDCHIGSQLTEIDPFLDAMDRLLFLVDELAKLGIKLKHLDLGGGLGVRYQQEIPPEPDTYAKAVMEKIQGRNLTLVFEPGRSIAANAGILVTQVDMLKDNGHKHFAIVDAAMNDLIRPSLYNAWQDIIQVKPRTDGLQANFDIVGPVCETGDFLGKGRELNLKPGDLLAVRSAGAYGFVMSSNYNSRNRAAEVMVDKGQHHLIRARETFSQQIANEYLLPN
ncbi:diaminopimelate decarboxylase [Spartinivicinus poritis]|uniref:Diaminopimelate decarboxylase n=1 Tax=Spartinivicinus poritis TaxID=2994640 RepID=A0ABT5UFV3_9GAMM|nr:diaminopimelate decarboxylase [Spartinivicinus sp. A2-2]MDE1465266.1 diaminopimelate decarboxylase [Spartinivicinus sp. A2-2]